MTPITTKPNLTLGKAGIRLGTIITWIGIVITTLTINFLAPQANGGIHGAGIQA